MCKQYVFDTYTCFLSLYIFYLDDFFLSETSAVSCFVLILMLLNVKEKYFSMHLYIFLFFHVTKDMTYKTI